MSEAENVTWQRVVNQVQHHRDDSIAKVQPTIQDVPSSLPKDVTLLPKRLLLAKEIEITQTSTEDLIASLAKGELTSTEVTRAYLRRAGLAQKLVSHVVCRASYVYPN